MRPDRRNQRGMGLIEDMVSLVIFSIGLLALAALYIRSAPQPAEDSDVLSIQAAATGAFSALAADPAALPISVSQASTSGAMPTQALAQWFQSASPGLPGLSVSIASGPDETGNACSVQSCGVTLTLAWNQMGETRSQEFNGQIGFH